MGKGRYSDGEGRFKDSLAALIVGGLCVWARGEGGVSCFDV